MDIRREEGSWIFEDMDAFVAELLRQLPACASPDDEKSRRRIFSSPTAGADEEADEEWRENVEPGQRELFQSHVDVVVDDLSGMKTEDEISSLRIMDANSGAWIHTLNQARLTLGAKHDVTEAEIEGRRRIRQAEKGYALLQIDFYAMLLSALLTDTEI